MYLFQLKTENFKKRRSSEFTCFGEKWYEEGCGFT